MLSVQPKGSSASGTEPIKLARSKSAPTGDRRPEEDEDAFADVPGDYEASEDRDDSLYTEFGAAEGEASLISFDEVDDYVPIGLENILRGICECLEPAREPSRGPTPPPPDPFGEFLERMKTEQSEGRLPTAFKVPGIGAPICSNHVTAVALWMTDCARRQQGLVGPRNITHFLCPDLQATCFDDAED
nr:uncharacterized protein LOC117222589 [Megalopta genalis]